MNIKNEEEYFWHANTIGDREFNSGFEIFLNNQSNNADLEIKVDDFGIDKYETTETNSSKMYSPSYQSNENQKSKIHI